MAAPAPSSPVAPSLPPSPAPLPPAAGPAGADVRRGRRSSVAREIRAAGLVGGLNTAQIAAEIHDRCAPLAGTSRIPCLPPGARRLTGRCRRSDTCLVRKQGPARRGSARRCCPPMRAGRSAPAPSTCITCAPCTGPSRPTWGTPASASAAGPHRAGPGATRPARRLHSRARPPAPCPTGGRAHRGGLPAVPPLAGAAPAASAAVGAVGFPADPRKPRTMTTCSAGCSCG